MLSKNQKFWNAFARYVQKPMLAMVAHQPTARLIADFNALLVYKTPRDLRMTPLKLTHDGTEIAATVCQSGPQPTGGTMLYLHGGAFMIGSLRMYRHLVASLARAANQRGVYLPYDLAPENAFPKALDQATAAYRALAADPDGGPVTLAGDSAGGNLVFALLHRICRDGLPQPAAVVALSPIVDMRMRAGSRRANAKSDHLIPLRWAMRGREGYLAGHDPEDPEVSPVLGRFTGAAPCLFHVDETEILFDDTQDMAARLRADGVGTTVKITHGRTHVWHLNVGRSPEADTAISEIGAFIRQTIAEAPNKA